MATKTTAPKIRGKTRTLVGNWQEDRANEGEEVDLRRGHPNLLTRGVEHPASEWKSVQQEAFQATQMQMGRDDARLGKRAALRQKQRLAQIQAQREAEEEARRKAEEEEIRKAHERKPVYGIEAEKQLRERKKREEEEGMTPYMLDAPITFYREQLRVPGADIASSRAVGVNPFGKSTRFSGPIDEYRGGRVWSE